MAGPLTPISFNGRPIYPFPASPAFSEISFSMTDSIAQTQSPWSMQMQTQQWVGADQWSATVSLPPMEPATYQTWQGWMGVLRGKLGMFQLGDPLRTQPQGVPMGTPTVTACSAGSTIISTHGWTSHTNNLLLVGDYIQIGYRLHIVCGNDTGGSVASNASGVATIEIWPSIRDQITADVSLITSNCKGLFQLASNTRSWSSVANEQLYTMSFKCVEAR